MKSISALIALAILTLSQWATAGSSLTGTWELEYAIYKNDKGEVVGEIKDKTTLSRKILSEEHFAFIT